MNKRTQGDTERKLLEIHEYVQSFGEATRKFPKITRPARKRLAGKEKGE